jgi:hypothetical protein
MGFHIGELGAAQHTQQYTVYQIYECSFVSKYSLFCVFISEHSVFSVFSDHRQYAKVCEYSV